MIYSEGPPRWRGHPGRSIGSVYPDQAERHSPPSAQRLNPEYIEMTWEALSGICRAELWITEGAR